MKLNKAVLLLFLVAAATQVSAETEHTHPDDRPLIQEWNAEKKKLLAALNAFLEKFPIDEENLDEDR